jgi:hypothetical protein
MVTRGLLEVKEDYVIFDRSLVKPAIPPFLAAFKREKGITQKRKSLLESRLF